MISDMELADSVLLFISHGLQRLGESPSIRLFIAVMMICMVMGITMVAYEAGKEARQFIEKCMAQVMDKWF